MFRVLDMCVCVLCVCMCVDNSEPEGGEGRSLAMMGDGKGAPRTVIESYLLIDHRQTFEIILHPLHVCGE